MAQGRRRRRRRAAFCAFASSRRVAVLCAPHTQTHRHWRRFVEGVSGFFFLPVGDRVCAWQAHTDDDALATSGATQPGNRYVQKLGVEAAAHHRSRRQAGPPGQTVAEQEALQPGQLQEPVVRADRPVAGLLRGRLRGNCPTAAGRAAHSCTPTAAAANPSLRPQNRRGREKGRVSLGAVKVVETVHPVPETPQFPCAAASAALQVVYNNAHQQCHEPAAPDLTLCIILPGQEERDDWLSSIRSGWSYTSKTFKNSKL